MRTGLNHWTVGKNHLYNLGQSCLDNSLGGTGCPSGAFGFVAGQYVMDFNLASPGSISTLVTTWQPACNASWIVGSTLPPCSFPLGYDSHLGDAANTGGLDTAPICGTIYNFAYNGNLGTPFIDAPWQDEEVCVPVSPTWGYGVSAVGQNSPWRFTHLMTTMTNTDFDTQFGISQLSTDGNYLAFSSDMVCTLGDTSGNATNNCGLPWQSGFVYTVNQTINPIGALNGTGTIYDVFKITTGGTSGTSFVGFATPAAAWASCTGVGPTCSVTDNNGVVYQDVGTGTAKGEVFIVQLNP
jgi:hypothetical protein